MPTPAWSAQPSSLAAPGCSLFLMSPADTWGGSRTRVAFIRSNVKIHLVRFANQCPLEPINHAGKRQLHHLPSYSDQAAPTLGFYHFSRLSDLSFHSLMLIPEYLSITRAFLSLDSLSTWPLILSPSPPSPLYVRACPPPLTPSSAPPP